MANNFLDKKTRQGLMYGSLLAAGIGAASGNSLRDAIMSAALAGSHAYTGGLNQLYKNKQAELEQERMQELIRSSQSRDALEQAKFQHEKEQWATRMPYLEALTGEAKSQAAARQQALSDEQTLRSAIEGTDFTGENAGSPEQNAIQQMMISDPALRRLYYSNKLGIQKKSTSTHWGNWMDRKGHVYPIDMNDPNALAQIEQLGLVPYSKPSSKMGLNELYNRTRTQMRAKRDELKAIGLDDKTILMMMAGMPWFFRPIGFGGESEEDLEK